MQIVADVLHPRRSAWAGYPSSCLGAAWTAAIGAGLAADWAVSRIRASGRSGGARQLAKRRGLPTGLPALP